MPSATPAACAKSRVVVPSNPWEANNRLAASRMRVRVCASEDGGELKSRLTVIVIFPQEDV